MFNINRGLCVYTNIINCSIFVKNSTGLHGFAEILAKKLAPAVRILTIVFKARTWVNIKIIIVLIFVV